jgi:GxxExxY protein
MNHRDTETQRRTEAPLSLRTPEGAEGKHRRDTGARKDPLTEKVVGAAIEVHRALGPGLLESAYEECLCHELSIQGVQFERQREVPVEYKGVKLDCGYRLDLLVEAKLIVELKASERILPVHEAQLLTYLRLLGLRRGLILNFGTAVLKDGIKRMVL